MRHNQKRNRFGLTVIKGSNDEPVTYWYPTEKVRQEMAIALLQKGERVVYTNV
jgi:hypothetical protein